MVNKKTVKKRGGTMWNSSVKKKGNTIVKKYKKNAHAKFLNELNIYLLSREVKMPYVPKLISFSIKKREIVTEYVGPTLKDKYRNDKKKKRSYISEIKKIYRKLLSHGYYHNDIRYKNVCIKGNKLYLIDFERTSNKNEDKNHDKIL